ncbi:hypothetical protein [Nocardia sp. NPDC019395]|uniref:hypothetical protein n=1 Tax=Nocardia sp. NPDC019395 TaxID=3154686 RepID=UPI0033CA55CC
MDDTATQGGDPTYDDVKTLVGEADKIARQLRGVAERGYGEIIYTPGGPDIAEELRRFVTAGR